MMPLLKMASPTAERKRKMTPDQKIRSDVLKSLDRKGYYSANTTFKDGVSTYHIYRHQKHPDILFPHDVMARQELLAIQNELDSLPDDLIPANRYRQPYTILGPGSYGPKSNVKRVHETWQEAGSDWLSGR